LTLIGTMMTDHDDKCCAVCRDDVAALRLEIAALDLQLAGLLPPAPLLMDWLS
jgi:hypothetical protein